MHRRGHRDQPELRPGRYHLVRCWQSLPGQHQRGDLAVYKAPLTFQLYRADNSTLVWRESTGLTWTSTTGSQTLARGATEQFYGTGLRLGDWALRGRTVPIRVDNAWRENNHASPAPFFMSTNGYGVVRNTWSPGQYDFLDPVRLTHNESRFAGSSMRAFQRSYFFTGRA